MDTTEKINKVKIVVKEPAQQRSRNTFDAIVDACARLLAVEGFYSLTTDKIAKEAGVSIGSLYQFFGNKESVVQELIKNILQKDKDYFAENMRPISPLPPKERVNALVDLLVEIMSSNVELRSKLSVIRYYASDVSLTSEYLKYFYEMISYNIPNLNDRNMKIVCMIFVNSLVGVTDLISLNEPSSISDKGVQKEIKTLLMNYIDLESTF